MLKTKTNYRHCTRPSRLPSHRWRTSSQMRRSPSSIWPSGNGTSFWNKRKMWFLTGWAIYVPNTIKKLFVAIYVVCLFMLFVWFYPYDILRLKCALFHLKFTPCLNEEFSIVFVHLRNLAVEVAGKRCRCALEMFTKPRGNDVNCIVNN